MKAKEREQMGYVLRVRLASFFTGVAVASVAGLYFLQEDYKTAFKSISEQANHVYESLDRRISAVEKDQKVHELSNGSISAIENFKEVEGMKAEDAAT